MKKFWVKLWWNWHLELVIFKIICKKKCCFVSFVLFVCRLSHWFYNNLSEIIKIIILRYFWLLLKVVEFFEAAGTVADIGLSLKSNYQIRFTVPNSLIPIVPKLTSDETHGKIEFGNGTLNSNL